MGFCCFEDFFDFFAIFYRRCVETVLYDKSVSWSVHVYDVFACIYRLIENMIASVKFVFYIVNIHQRALYIYI